MLAAVKLDDKLLIKEKTFRFSLHLPLPLTALNNIFEK
ncbi:hypothetical protein AC77_2526 [Escherichia coli 5-366-08_S4_C1]|nr:hypothetical protein ECDEC10A_1721 [Escherichia coli DEC10A]EKH36805.1 hypothetical protein ECFRIK1997_3441 [Escherichia coli FRIK1997]EKJ14251.1 hypothetical protein ECEC1865_3455 [Escherichia coli EC1865]EKJ61851.1 hypothetical protein EC01288_0557 [Escherichia coli 0.1288]KEO23729.1 hypothetical protein AC77_2526 [Escherichia coli 5-366-08_S4_C1]